MKKKRLKNFIGGMKECGNLDQTAGYGVARNRRNAEQELEDCEKARARPKGYNVFEEAEKELVTKHSIGSNAQGQAVFGKNAPAFEAEYNALREKHAALLKEDEKCLAKWEKYMEREIEFPLYFIKESDIPDQTTANQRYWLLEFVEEPKESVEEKPKSK